MTRLKRIIDNWVRAHRVQHGFDTYWRIGAWWVCLPKLRRAPY